MLVLVGHRIALLLARTLHMLERRLLLIWRRYVELLLLLLVVWRRAGRRRKWRRRHLVRVQLAAIPKTNERVIKCV
jgi:hypothetical protein